MRELNEEQEDSSKGNWFVDRRYWEKIERSWIVENREAAAEAVNNGIKKDAYDLSLFSWSDVAGEVGNGEEEADEDGHNGHCSSNPEEEVLEMHMAK